MKILNDFILSHKDIRGKTSLLVHLDCGCNLRCYKCYNYQDLVVDRDRLEWVRINKLFDFLNRDSHVYDYIILSGGEPTLLGKKLVKLCDYLKDHYRIKVALNTNGTRPEILKELIEKRIIDSVYMDLKFPFSNYNFNNYKKEWQLIYGLSYNQKIQSLIEESLTLLYKSPIHFELRTVKYPFLKPSFLKKYTALVEELNQKYRRKIVHNFNEFYLR